jgi:hypothetical protein
MLIYRGIGRIVVADVDDARRIVIIERSSNAKAPREADRRSGPP